ncbi:lipocalin family protein [Christiangramia echinicola]|uniref:lipocalin family protein n=1 Tax=Christiangramia echinicola TaxID=279359 RepID=UPI0003FF6805|nr:lipocalin family protein [Christiangramia echinicola]
MKKVLILLLSISMFTSCSDDDDSGSDDGTRIVGKWFLEALQPIGGQNTLNSCNQNSYIVFNADGSGNSEFFEESGANCESEGESPGNWSFEGGNTYTFLVPSLGNTTGNVNFEGDNQFTFTSSELPGVEIIFVK